MSGLSNSLNIPSIVDTAVVGTGTGFGTVGYTPVNAGDYLAQRDFNGNCSFNTVIETTTVTVSAGQTIPMSYGSSQIQETTGTAVVNFVLPDSTTLILGWTFVFDNIGTGINNVYLHDGVTLLTTVLGGAYCLVTCGNNSTSNGVWKFYNTLATGSLSGTLGTTLLGFLAANTIIPGYTTTATAAATTTLTVASTEQQYFTGTTTQTVVLPVTSTLVLGQSFLISNNSTGVVTVESSGANTIQAMAADSQLIVTVILTSGTTAASWSAAYIHNGGSSSVTISGDSGSIAGTSLTIFSDLTANNSGSSVSFVNSGTTSTFNLTDSNHNTLLGKLSGNTSITGTDNVGLGNGCLAALTSGAQNCALGQQSAAALTQGLRNVSVGNGSMLIATTADDNISIGAAALSNLANNNANIAIGTSALAASTTDTANQAIGYASLTALNGGDYNTACGYEAGTALASGSYNLYLGASSGSTNTTSESNNVYLNSVGVIADSNTLRIGNSTGSGNLALNKAFISGINGNTVSNSVYVVIDTINDQLGTVANPSIAITGDTGSMSGHSLTIYADTAANNCGSSVSFVNSGTTSTLNVTDSASNTVIGLGSGNSSFASSSALNTVLGYQCMPLATSTAACVTIGYQALNAFTGGSQTTAIGYKSLVLVSTGQLNTAVGSGSGQNLTTGNRNLYFGIDAGTNHTSSESNNVIINSDGVTGESNTLRIGNGTGTGSQQIAVSFISGIQGVSVTGAAVIVSTSDQLGVIVSSRKYKDNIKDMDDYSSSILDLRPVVFHAKGDKLTLIPGLIAEEVAEVMPDLVVYDSEGDPQTVKYHELPAMLLNELQKALSRIEILEAKLRD